MTNTITHLNKTTQHIPFMEQITLINNINNKQQYETILNTDNTTTTVSTGITTQPKTHNTHYNH